MERTGPEGDVAFGRADACDRRLVGAQPPSHEHLRSTSFGHSAGAGGRYSATLRRFVAGWAVLGVVLTSATQLRSEAAPIGPGELLLVGWMLFVGLLLFRGLRFTSGQTFRVLAAYWAAAAVLLGFGALMALRMSVPMSPRDAFAYFFVAVFSCLLALVIADDRGDHHARLAYLTFFAAMTVATALLAVATVLPSIGPIDFWFGPRFRGWANNPNQMALLLVGMPFLGLYLLRRPRRAWRGAVVVYGLAIACCAWVGLATASDSLRVAWAVSLGGIGALVWYRAVLRSRGAVMYISHLVVPIVVVALGYAYGPELVERVQRSSEATYEEGDQGSTRLILWSNGIKAIAHSPLVGLGPGSHSGIYGPLEGAEAHNSFIDWGTSTGFLGVALHLCLLTWSGWRAIRANSAPLLGLVAALAIFGTFNYIFRQPIYWLLLVLALTLTERRNHAARARAPSAPAGRGSSGGEVCRDGG